jgi:Sigma-70, region 4
VRFAVLVRKREVRAHTVSMRRASLPDLAAELGVDGGEEPSLRQLPVLRRECINGERPCPYVSCQHHLFLDVSDRTGAIKVNFPDLVELDGPRLDEMSETCVLDVADRGGATLEEVGAFMNLTRERVRQVEVNGLKRIERTWLAEHDR